MSPYQQVLELARQQVEACSRGDLDEAVDSLDVRAALLAAAPPPSTDDLEAIRETLRIDRELSGAIRGRMIAIRDETLRVQRGRTALSGYSHVRPANPAYCDQDA
jgi:hypothetical protein